MIDRAELGQHQDVLRKKRVRRASAEVHRFQEVIWATTGMSYEEKQGLLDQMSYHDYASNRRSFSTFRDMFQSLGIRLPAPHKAQQVNEGVATFLSNIGIANRKIQWGDNSACIILRADMKLIREFLATRRSKDS